MPNLCQCKSEPYDYLRSSINKDATTSIILFLGCSTCAFPRKSVETRVFSPSLEWLYTKVTQNNYLINSISPFPSRLPI